MAEINGYVAHATQREKICFQPRMGFGTIDAMRDGLRAVAQIDGATICTITLDSFTRVGHFDHAARALSNGERLNGFPIVSHSLDTVRELVSQIDSEFDKPIQVRHGSPRPQQIFRRLVDAGIKATEGGPVSYCLPYGAVALKDALAAWAQSVEILANSDDGHIESFAGCMLGQLYPPSMLIAINIIEGLFFRQHGLKSMSFSLAQGTCVVQDVAALEALERLRAKYLPDMLSHVVFYMYMGIFPETVLGAMRLMRNAVLTACCAKVGRLIVKTPAEASRIPSVEENIASIEYSRHVETISDTFRLEISQADADDIEGEAERIILSVLNLGPTLSGSILAAFHKGLLDIPFCIHPDNRNECRTFIDQRGFLRWANKGRLDIKAQFKNVTPSFSASGQLLAGLKYMRRKYDEGSHLSLSPICS